MRGLGLFVLMVVFGLPAMEIYAMFKVADYIGWWLLAWLFASMILGTTLIKEESMAIFGRLAMALQSGQSPFTALWQSGRTMLAGVLLIFPGVVSDAFALILLLWPGKSPRPPDRPIHDDGIVEGEAYVVEAEKIEVKKERF